jgi:hypothetical protein
MTFPEQADFFFSKSLDFQLQWLLPDLLPVCRLIWGVIDVKELAGFCRKYSPRISNKCASLHEKRARRNRGGHFGWREKESQHKAKVVSI